MKNKKSKFEKLSDKIFDSLQMKNIYGGNTTDMTGNIRRGHMDSIHMDGTTTHVGLTYYNGEQDIEGHGDWTDKKEGC